MISGSEAHHESHYAPAPVQKEEDLPVVGKRHSLIAIGCLVVVLLCSAVALGSPDWISFSYKDLQYKVQNSRSVIPLLPHQSSVKLTAGLIRATVEWKHYPSSFSTCQGATQGLNSRQLISSGACGRVGVDVNSSCPDGSYSGGVDGAVDFICSLKFNYTSWTEELITQHLTDVHGKVDINKLNVSYLCDAPGILIL